MTVGTQAALLAGFAFTGVIEAPWDHLEEMGVPEPVVTLCVCSTLFGMLFQVLAIVKSVQISILGPGLALRGSEGSMTRALSVMRHEQRRLHWQFYIGLAFFFIATGCFCGALFRPVTKIIAISAISLTFIWMILDCKSVASELWLPPAASLWRSEVDRRKNVRCSCTGAMVASSSGVADSFQQRRQQQRIQRGAQQEPSAGCPRIGRPAVRRRVKNPLRRIARSLPDPITGSFRVRETSSRSPSGSLSESAMAAQTHASASLRGHPDEYAVRYARRFAANASRSLCNDFFHPSHFPSNSHRFLLSLSMLLCFQAFDQRDRV